MNVSGTSDVMLKSVRSRTGEQDRRSEEVVEDVDKDRSHDRAACTIEDAPSKH